MKQQITLLFCILLSYLGQAQILEKIDNEDITNIKNKKLIRFINKKLKNVNPQSLNFTNDIATILRKKEGLWRKIDAEIIMQVILKDTLFSDYTRSHFVEIIENEGSTQQKKRLNTFYLQSIKENKSLIFRELPRTYWNDNLLTPLFKAFEKDSNYTYCYSRIFNEINHLTYKVPGENAYCNRKIDSSMIARLYQITNAKKALFFKNDKTKQDTLKHFKEWTLILTHTGAKEWIPYLKTFLKDTATILDNDNTRSDLMRQDNWCGCPKPKNREILMDISSGIVCGDSPLTVRDFALVAIYKLQGKNICSAVSYGREKIDAQYFNDLSFCCVQTNQVIFQKIKEEQAKVYDILIEYVDKDFEKEWEKQGGQGKRAILTKFKD